MSMPMLMPRCQDAEIFKWLSFVCLKINKNNLNLITSTSLLRVKTYFEMI